MSKISKQVLLLSVVLVLLIGSYGIQIYRSGLILKELIAVAVFTSLSSVIASSVNYYQTLGISKTASPDEIKKKYRQLAKQYHPDKNPTDTEAAEKKFIEISQAYETLSDPEKRRSYDEELTFNRNPGSRGRGGFDSFQNFQNHQNRAKQWQGQRVDPFEQFRRQFEQFEREQEEYEETTYVFQGRDGRIYYQKVRQPKQKNSFHYEYSFHQEDPSLFQRFITYFFQYLFVPLLPIFMVLACNCCCPTAKKTPAATPPPIDPHNESPSSSNDTSMPPKIKIPIVANQYLHRRGVITVVALKRSGIKILAILQPHFRNDPFLFTFYDPTVVNEDIEPIDTVLALGQANNEEFDLIAFSKNGKRFIVLSLDDRSNNNTNSQQDESTSLQLEKEKFIVTKQWLEKLIEGNINWNTIN